MWAENNEQKFENLSNYIIKKELKLLHKRKVIAVLNAIKKTLANFNILW